MAELSPHDPRAIAMTPYVRSRLPHADVAVGDDRQTDSMQIDIRVQWGASVRISEESLAFASNAGEIVDSVLDDMIYRMQQQAPKEFGLPAVENTEIWVSDEIADAATRLGLRSGLPVPLLYEQRDDGSAVIPADQLRKLLTLLGYHFHSNVGSKAAEQPSTEGRTIYRRSAFTQALQADSSGQLQLAFQQGRIKVIEDDE